MPASSSFDYAIVRVVPHVEREEFINVGVILFCRTRRFLDACIEVDPARLRALAPRLNPAQVSAHLSLIPQICAGTPNHPIGRLSQAERFHWLVTPRSTSVQVSPVHCGICTDPAAALNQLMDEMVRLDG
ncbi:MAG: DUF3037 domain-containing protein [Chloroflexi bacterium]|nr:MAG: DUF3037 domain-containing protein [Chloroflexota bacterium]